MTDDELLGAIDTLHDRWFSVDDIEFDPAARTWSVPFTRDSKWRPPRVPSLRGIRGAPLLEVRGVDSYELTDTEQVHWYMFNVLKYHAADGLLEIESSIPLGLRLHVSSPAIRIVEQE